MSPAQLSMQEVVTIMRRRRNPLTLPPVLVTILCIIGVFLITPRYESSTTILVQRDEILNPLISYEMAVTTASEDRLRTFNEIIYSQTTIQTLIDSLGLGYNQTTIQTLIDSLGLGGNVRTETERQELIKKTRRNVLTRRPGSTSFTISYLDSDPIRAQKGATLLANHFMRTMLSVENQRNELAMTFFSNKLEEYRRKFEESQSELVPLVQRRIDETPIADQTLSIQIEDLDDQVQEIEDRIQVYREALGALRTFPKALQTMQGRQSLFDLQRLDLPHVSDLRPILTTYDEYVNLKKYTSRYPEVAKIESQILALTSRMREAIERDIPEQRKRQRTLEARRAQFVGSLKRSNVAQRVDQDKESNYGIYRGLYEEMKVKLEQARTTYDLGKKGENQFIILDPPIVPKKPVKPNRPLIIFGGFGLGILLGVVSAAVMELLDTRVHGSQDLAHYNKPSLAFIPDEGKAV